MDIKIDKSIPKPTEDEMEDIMDRSRSLDDATPKELEAMRAEMAVVKTVIIPEHVLEQLNEMGMSPEEVTAIILKKLKLTQ